MCMLVPQNLLIIVPRDDTRTLIRLLCRTTAEA